MKIGKGEIKNAMFFPDPRGVKVYIIHPYCTKGKGLERELKELKSVRESCLSFSPDDCQFAMA